ncbi:hypothetical protein MBLNU457_g2579t1 [Dothideomycetes sp. NU457]
MKENRDGLTTANTNANNGDRSLPSSLSNDRLRTPEERTDASLRENSPTSPMSVTTPVNGVKRTANGIVKNNTSSVVNSPANATPTERRRAESVSSSSSKAGEAAANLKTRLAYAMAKVQHGWEHKNMSEVEQLAASMSPGMNFSSPREARAPLTSPRQTVFTDRPTARLPMAKIPLYDPYASSKGPMSPPAKRRSSVLDSAIPNYRPAFPPQHDDRAGLAPAVELAPRTHDRRVSFNKATSSRTNGVPPSPTKYMPTTPKSSRKPAAIRTSTQTARDEQDAMAALLLMGSPSNGGHFPKGSQQSSGSLSPPQAHSVTNLTPRQAMKHRSESYDSVSRSSEEAPGRADSVDRRAILDQIEAE